MLGYGLWAGGLCLSTASQGGGVLSLDQVLYSALDLLWIRVEVREQLLRGLGDELLVRKSPAHLHDADDRSIDLE
jgi:hypothetical protein